jgi:hypothetical protein
LLVFSSFFFLVAISLPQDPADHIPQQNDGKEHPKSQSAQS